MAPDSKILKRKRSRPSEWWTVGQNISKEAVETDKPAEKKLPKNIEPNKNISLKYQNSRFALRSSSRRERIISNMDRICKTITLASNASERTKPLRKESGDGDDRKTVLFSSNNRPCSRGCVAISKARQQDHAHNLKKTQYTPQNIATQQYSDLDDELSIYSQSRLRLEKNNNERRHQETSIVEIEVASSSLAKAHSKKKSNTTCNYDLNSNYSQSSLPSKPPILSSSSHKDTSSNLGSSKNFHKRRLENDEQEDLSSEPEINYKFSYPKLKPEIKPVSRLAIESRWGILSSDCVENISLLLKDIQLPVIVSYKSKKKNILVNGTLKMISDKIVKKISNDMLFPQRAGRKRDEDFDFKKISNRNRHLEDQLTPVLHANELLRSALDKEIEYLRIERQRLSSLETNSKKETAHRNQSFRRLHPALQIEHKNDIYDLEEDIGLEPATKRKYRSISLMGKPDEELAHLIEQIQNHVNSLLINIDQVDGINDKIAESKANLQATLFDNIGGKEYEYIVTGTE